MYAKHNSAYHPLFLVLDSLSAVQTQLFYLYALALEYIYSSLMKQSGVKEPQFSLSKYSLLHCLLMTDNCASGKLACLGFMSKSQWPGGSCEFAQPRQKQRWLMCVSGGTLACIYINTFWTQKWVILEVWRKKYYFKWIALKIYLFRFTNNDDLRRPCTQFGNWCMEDQNNMSSYATTKESKCYFNKLVFTNGSQLSDRAVLMSE